LSDEIVDDVELPKWASSAAAFIALNRIALESPFVSSHLHQWIDLIFGTKQRSEAANNLFHPFTYPDAINTDPESVPLVQTHAANFGITPTRLFSHDHPQRKYSPPEHILLGQEEGFLAILHFCTFEKSPLKFSVVGNAFSVLFEDGDFAVFSAGKSGLTFTRSAQFEIRSKLSSHRTFVLPARNSVVVSPPWSSTFSVFSIVRKQSETPAVHSSAITAIATDGDYCVTGAGDSSILVWDLTTETIITQIVAHTSGIALVAVCAFSEIVVSCDISGTLVFSALTTGNFLQRRKLDRVPDVVLLSPLGFCVFLSWIETDTGFQTEVQLTDISGRPLAKREYAGKCAASKIIENRDASSYIVMAQETNVVYVLAVWDLRQISIGPVGQNVKDIAYDADTLKLFLLLGNNQVHVASLAVST
jgi:hypothetical protein